MMIIQEHTFVANYQNGDPKFQKWGNLKKYLVWRKWKGGMFPSKGEGETNKLLLQNLVQRKKIEYQETKIVLISQLCLAANTVVSMAFLLKILEGTTPRPQSP